MESSLSKLILILLSIAIILLFVINLVPFLSKSGDKAVCKNWVNMQSRAKIAGIQLPSLIESPCVTFSDKIQTKTEDKIYKQLAEDMYDCWDMYGAGKIDFFSDWGWENKENYCIVCNEIEIDKGINKELDIDDFEEYLSNHNPPSHKESYAQYFLGPDYGSIDFGSGSIKINSETPLYIMFVVSKKKGDIGPTTLSQNIGMATGCGIGLKAGFALGTFFPGIGNLVFAGGGCIVGIVGTAIFFETTYADVLYPSIFLAPGEDILKKGCSSYYYKPKEEKSLIKGVI